MHFSAYLVLFAGSALAQSSVTLFNLHPFAETLTQIGSDATATTYKNVCPSDRAGISGLPASLRPTLDNARPTITPAPTPRARFARQATPIVSASDDNNDDMFCEPFIMKQGASTWEIHMTDPLPGAWTVDINCKWQGAITDADVSCLVTADGDVLSKQRRGTTTSVFSKDDIKSMELISAIAVVTLPNTASASASQTPSGSGAKSGAPTASAASSGSGAGAASPSTGLAPAGPLPTGAVAFVGGAAGLFIAALAL